MPKFLKGRAATAGTTVQASLLTRARTWVNQRTRMRTFFFWRGRTEADERSWTERTAAGVTTPRYVSVPAAIFATTATFAVAGILPAFGIDATGTLAAFSPSEENLGGQLGAKVAAASIGLLIWFAAFAAGTQLWSAVHGRITRGQALLAALAAITLLLFPMAITRLGADRSNGEQAAAKYALADELDAKATAKQDEIDSLQANLLRSPSSVPEDARVTRLQAELKDLSEQLARAEAEGDRARTLGSLTWLQIAAFFAMCGAGAYFEAASLLRLERRIPVRRARTDGAYCAIEYAQDAVVAIPRLGLSERDRSGGEHVANGVALDVDDVTHAQIGERIPRPNWRTWEQMRIDAAIEAELRRQLAPGGESAVGSVIAERARRIIDERIADGPDGSASRHNATEDRTDQTPSMKVVN